jgi:hypothetical protein
MRTFPDVRMRELMSGVRRATSLMEKGEHAEALQVLTDVRARATPAGIDSAFVAWNVAQCQHALDDLEAAFESICQAARLDPLAQPIQSTFEAISWALRASMADPERAPTDIAIRRMYYALMLAGEADVTSHVAMAKHLSAAGEHRRALEILDAVTLLAGVSQDAWRAKGAVARAAGDDALAAECEAQVEAIAEQDVPFAMGMWSAANC